MAAPVALSFVVAAVAARSIDNAKVIAECFPMVTMMPSGDQVERVVRVLSARLDCCGCVGEGRVACDSLQLLAPVRVRPVSDLASFGVSLSSPNIFKNFNTERHFFFP